MARTYGKAQDLIDFTRASGGTCLRRVKYGAELVTNGTFDSDTTGWTGNGPITVVSQQLYWVDTDIGGAYTTVSTEAGKIYRFTFDITVNSGTVRFSPRSGSLGGSQLANESLSTGSYTFDIVADASSIVLYIQNTNGAGGEFYLDNVSAKETIFDTSDGDLLLFNHPNNVPRIEYDANGNLLGLLVEESRTNLNTQSESYIGQYSLDNVTLTEGQSSPDGQTSAVKLTVDTTSGNAAILRSVPATSTGTQYVVSAFVKKGENRYATLFGWGNGTNGIAFDIQELTYQINDSWDAGGVIDINDEWVRIWGAVTPLVSTVCYVGMVKSLGSSRAWDGGEYLTVFGIQVEQGSSPTSYIPTSGSTATRSADVASIGVDGFGYRQDEGTLVVEAQSKEVGVNRLYALTEDGGIQDAVYSYAGSSGHLIIRANNVTEANIDAGTFVADTYSKLAATYKTNDSAVTIDGGTVQTDTSVNLPTTVNIMFFGSSPVNFLNGHIKSIKYIPRRLTNDQLVELTS